MPTYEYECKKCGHVFEEFQRITAEPLTKCPKCSGKLVRLPGAGAGIIFKGSGFYATDYRSDSYKRAAKGEGSSHGKHRARTDKHGADKTDSAGKGDGGAGGTGAQVDKDKK